MIFRGSIISISNNIFQIKSYKNKKTIIISVADTQNKYSNLKINSRISLKIEDNLVKCQCNLRNLINLAVLQCQCYLHCNFEISKDNFCLLADLDTYEYNNSYACVVSVWPLYKTKGTDYVFTLKLADNSGESTVKIFISSINNLKKFMKEEEFNKDTDYSDINNFNRIFKGGDIVLVKNIKKIKEKSVCLIHKSSCIYKIKNINEIKENDSKIKSINESIKEKHTDSFKSDEEFIIKELEDFYIENYFNKKTLKVEEIQKSCYFNIIGEIIYINEEDIFEKTICILDYTSNSHVISEFRGNYPLNMLLYIKLYKKNFEDNIKIGQICHFKNLRIDTIRDCLLAYVGENTDYKIDLMQTGNEVEKLLERKRMYLVRINQAAEHINCLNADKTSKETAEHNAEHNNSINNDKKSEETAEHNAEHINSINNDKNSVFDDINFVLLKSITIPGIYYVRINVDKIEVLSSKRGKYIEVQIYDDSKTITAIIRQKLTKKLMSMGLKILNQTIECILLSVNVKTQEFYIVDLI